jgi:acyl phosphate:glycerol-3-phosphate acyltransferase
VNVLFPVAFGYLLGSVPFAYLLARRHAGIDLRRAGSGNVGAANVLRTIGVRIGLGAMMLDVAKGAAAVLVAERLGAGPVGPTAAGLAAIVGHMYPVWLGFRGGKGVATTCGVFAVLAPLATAIAGALFVTAVWWSRYVSIGSVVGSVMLGPLAYLTHAPAPVVVGAVVAGAIVLERHRANVGRLLAGVERRIGQRA